MQDEEIKAVILSYLRDEKVVKMPMADKNRRYEFKEEEDGGLFLTMERLQNNKKEYFYPLVVDNAIFEENVFSPVIVDCPVVNILKAAYYDPEIQGVVYKPFQGDILLTKKLIGEILDEAA